MKKLLFLAVAILTLGSVKAQTDITIGPKVGLNVTNVTNSDGNGKISFHLGGFAEFKFNDYVALQSELLYSRQGYRWKSDGIKYKNRINYLNIPVLAKLYVLEDLSVDLGPQFGFALNNRVKSKSGGTTTKIKVKDFNVFDVSFAFGVSYNYEDFMVSARYNLGLTNIYSNRDENNKNHVFQLSVGYRFSDLF